MAWELQSQERYNELRLLLPLHRAADPTDPWLTYYRGKLYLRDKEWQKAADVLSQAMKEADEDLRPRFRSSYLYAIIDTRRKSNRVELAF